MGFWDELEEDDPDFDEAPEEGTSVEDGNYKVVVKAIELTESKGGKPMVKWTLEILAPRYIGRFLWRYNVIVTAQNKEWLKKDLATAGLRGLKLVELPVRIEELVGVELMVTKKTNGEFDSVYINKRLSPADGAHASGTPASGGEGVTPDEVIPASGRRQPKAPPSNLDGDDNIPF